MHGCWLCSPYQSAVWFSQTVTNFSNAGVQHGDVAYEKKNSVFKKKQQLITACPESLASHLFIAPLSLIWSHQLLWVHALTWRYPLLAHGDIS